MFRLSQSPGWNAIGSGSQEGLWRWDALGLDRSLLVPKIATGRVFETLDAIAPTHIVNCSAAGAYHWQENLDQTYLVNAALPFEVSSWAQTNRAVLVQLGSSSEYGYNSNQPVPQSLLVPNSHYALAKAAGSLSVTATANFFHASQCVLRMYSIFGPLEHPDRLFPTLVREGIEGRYPVFGQAHSTRDYVFIDDAVTAIEIALGSADRDLRGQAVSVCSGQSTTLLEVASAARRVFGLDSEPRFGPDLRPWEVARWQGVRDPILSSLGWEPLTGVADGLEATKKWYLELGRHKYLSLRGTTSPQAPRGLIASTPPRAELAGDGLVPDITFVVACYRDEPALRELVQRARMSCQDNDLSYEIIIVNDASPDGAQRTIEDLSREDSRVRGIVHSRNFGSQAAFLSGMKQASGHFVALLDGDLQDPPELVPEMVRIAQTGYDVVYGERVKRDEGRMRNLSYKAFYRILSRISSYPMPRDAGDFSVLSRRASQAIAQMPERELFIRSQRAYVGFTSIGYAYERPARKYGRSTNSLTRNIAWALKGFISASRVPLAGIYVVTLLALGLSVVLGLVLVASWLVNPSIAPRGYTSLALLVVLMGVFSLGSMAMMASFLGRVHDEVRNRPRFVVSSTISRGVCERNDWYGLRDE